MRAMIAFTFIAVVSPAVAEPFSLVEQNLFLKSCIGDNTPLTAYCECTLNELQKRIKAADMRELGAKGQQAMMNDDRFSAAVLACSDKMPETLTEVEQKSFLKSCTGDNASLTAYCECTLTELLKRMGAAGIRQLGFKGQEAAMNDEGFSAAVVACSDKMPAQQ